MTRWLRGALWLLMAAARAHLLAPAPARRLQLYGWQLELHENHAIKSPYYDACQFYQGRVLNEQSSAVTLTECDDKLYGLIQVNGQDFVLEPGAERKEDAHVLRRRDFTMTDHAPAYNLTGDTVEDLELDFEEDELHVRPRRHKTEKDYFRDVPPVTKPPSGVQDLWLEMAIVADHSMVKFHGRHKVKHYILALMNIVSAIFNDPSLGSNMTLVINKLYLYEKQDSVIKSGNVKKSLDGVNKWNNRHLAKLPSGITGWDAAVWLTREDLGGPSGFSPLGGVCSRKRSAAIDRDEGLTSAFVVAHELAHLLGLTHDGNGLCDKEARQRSVMAPTILATLHNYAWSSCSKKQFHEKSKNWSCLHERSRDYGVELGGSKELVNYVFTMDEQCRMEFGDGFSVCTTVKTRTPPCARLYCAHRSLPHVCRSKRAPPLEGTPCRKNHWCVGRVCEPMPGSTENGETETETEVDQTPRWDEWKPWTDCNAYCGYGLRTRTRYCLVRGAVEEDACEGASTQAAICWAGRTCASQRDMRADVCRRHADDLIPHIDKDESKQCVIWCVNFTGGEPLNYGALPDGTPCSYERPFDLCFNGACVHGQCNSSDPSCNWCPDGYCSNNTHLYSRQLAKGWSRLAVVPRGAHQLNIHISTNTPLEIAVRERRRDRLLLKLSKHSIRYKIPEDNYLKYDTMVPQNLQIVDVESNIIDVKDDRYGLEGSVVAAGAVLEWRQTDADVFLSAKSLLQTDLMIMGAPVSPDASMDPITIQISLNYSTSASRIRPKEYRWAAERGSCSVTCGGGTRWVRTRCTRGQRCTPVRYEPCNINPCEFVWAPGEWEECSATCGDDGVQERQLFCVPLNSSISTRRDMIRHSVSPALCKVEAAPARRQPCNQLPCPVYWQEMPWTQCSTTCGRGYSVRPLSCPATDDQLCGSKPRERRRRCRNRRCPNTEVACSSPDENYYCELVPFYQLNRYCGIPEFKKYCCRTCEKGMRNVG